MNKTGFGYLRLPQLETEAGQVVDLDAVNALTDEFLALGGTYFDTAYTYLGGRSEDALRRCPMNIPIPQYFALYNEYARTPEQGWKMGHAYRALAEKGGKASHCITCRMCEGSCPQKLPITEHLQAVAKAFE